MKNRIIFSDGGKGGVGKSTVSAALADYLIRQDLNPIVIEADISNPDVGRMFKDHDEVISASFDLRETFDWSEFVVKVEEFQKDGAVQILVNLPATINFKGNLNEAIETFKLLDIEIISFFTMSRSYDSVSLLDKSFKSGLLSLSDRSVVVLNGIHGEEKDFTRFNQSGLREKIADSGGSVIFIPELFYRSYDICFLELHKTFSLVEKEEIPLLYKVQIGRWLTKVYSVFDSILPYSSEHDVSCHMIEEAEAD